MKRLFSLIIAIAIIGGYRFTESHPDNQLIIKARTVFTKYIHPSQSIDSVGTGEVLSGTSETNTGNTKIANPASTYCREHNGKLDIKESSGGQYGVCTFDNGSSCEEWAYFRGECSPKKENNNGTTQPPVVDTNTGVDNPTICTMQYAPVCAKVQVQCIKAPCPPIEQTFGNKCQMNANKLAVFSHDGECSGEQK